MGGFSLRKGKISHKSSLITHILMIHAGNGFSIEECENLGKILNRKSKEELMEELKTLRSKEAK